MKPLSMVAIYMLFWTISLFIVLPFGVRTDEEAGVQRRPGHADSAPHHFSFGRAAVRATVVAAVFFLIFYINYREGWIGIESFDWWQAPSLRAH